MRFTVIIPSKTRSNFERCVDAINQHEGVCSKLVIDDGLGYEVRSCERMYYCEWAPGVKPFVFARNVNLGINRAFIDPECDGVVILNDDALLETPAGFSRLAAECQKDPTIGVIGATTNLGHRCQKPQNVGLRFVEHFAYVAVYIPRATIERVGLLDERFTAYGYDDNDYNIRVRQAGLKCAVHDGCYVDHGSLKSTFRGDPRTPAQLAAGRRIFQEKWGAGVPV